MKTTNPTTTQQQHNTQQHHNTHHNNTTKTTWKARQTTWSQCKEVNIEILPPEGLNPNTKTPSNFHRRIKCAWTTFTSHRPELTTPKILFEGHGELFDATVSPSLLCERKQIQKKLLTTQRMMLRMLVQTNRKVTKRHKTTKQQKMSQSPGLTTK